MWKKIQTLYLGITIALTIAMFFMNFATIVGGDGLEHGIKYYEKVEYLIMLIMLLAANVLAFFASQFPILQARISMISALLFLGFQVWLAFDFFEYKSQMTFSISAVFPIVATILDSLAARSAMVDGMTFKAVKSLKTTNNKRVKGKKRI